MMLSIKRYCIVAALVLLSAATALAQETVAPGATVVSLDSVLRYVSENNPTLQQYDYRARAMDAYAEGAKSWMPPMVGGGLFMAPYPGQSVMDGRDKGMFMISAEQDIPNPAKQRAREKYLRSRAAIENAGRDYTFNQLRADVKAAYYEWIVLEKKQAVLQESERIMQFMHKLALVRYPYNQASLGSIYKAEARLHEVNNMQLMNRSEIVQKRIQLNILMNLPKDTEYLIDTTVAITEQAIPDISTELINSTRSDIKQLEQTIASMRLNLELENLERKPEFKVRFDHMYPRDNMMPQQFTAMGMISIPIAPWSSKMYKANVKAMELEIAGMELERDYMLNEVQSMVRSMAIEVNTKREQVQNYKTKIIPALRKNYNATMLAYEQNTTELPLVIDAWEALNMAQMEYLNNLEQLYLMVVNYEKELER